VRDLSNGAISSGLQWPLPNPDFKVASLFIAEYLRNDTI